MTRAEKFIPKILFAEGGEKYTNDPNDSGAGTKYGISDARDGKVDGLTDINNDGKGDVKVENLTRDQAIEIYKKLYFDPCKIDLINDEFLALHVFDFAVNSGVGRSIKTLQKVVGVKDDGIIGNQTLAKANSKSYVEEFKQARIVFYKSIGTGKNAKFLKGWINRVNNLKL